MRRIAIPAFYLGLAVLITWPLVTVMSTELVGHPFGDSYEYVRHIWWIKHALQTGQPIFDQPFLAYPDGLSGNWLWGNPLQSFPAWFFAFVLPLPSAFNLALLLTLALNGWAMHVLVFKLTQQRPAALLAGIIFLAAPVFQGQLGAGHTGLLVLWPLPLYVYNLVQLTSVGARFWRPLFAAALFFVMSLLGSQLILIYLVAPITALFLLMHLVVRDWHGLLRIVAAAVVGGALALIFLVPVAAEQLSLPAQAREGNEVRYSADLLSIVTPSFYHPLFGQLDYTHQVLGIEPFERVGYIGIAAGLFALLGVWKFRLARWWLLLALIAWVFSLGPLLKVLDTLITVPIDAALTHIPLPWTAFHDLPLLNLSRTPARFNMTIAFALAMMVGYGAAYLSKIIPAKGVIFAVCVALILYEYQFFWPVPTIAGIVPEPIQALAQRDDVRAVFNVPWAHLLTDKDGLFLQTGHQQPMIAGHVARRTPVNPAKLSILQASLDYALLDAAGADVVILHKEWDGGVIEPFVRERLGTPFFEDERLAAFDVPAPDNEPVFTATLGDLIPITTTYNVYFYIPAAGQVLLRGEFAGDNRELSITLDGAPEQTWVIDGIAALEVAFAIPTAGYYTITLAVEPPCPASPAPILSCRSITINHLTLESGT